MTAPIATLIVVTFNSRRWLARQRAALDALEGPPFELIVWDNASRDDERPTQAELPAGARLILCTENLGFAEGNNRAAALAGTRYLVFLNPDAFPARDWLAQLVAAAEAHPEAAAFGSTQWRADAPGVLDGAGDVLHASGMAYRSGYGRRRDPPPTGETFAACGAAMLVRRAAFEAVGGFDAGYFCYFEDVDLCFRLRLCGHTVLQVREAAVEHVGGGSSGAASGFANFHGARNRVWTFVKCMPLPLLLALAPAHLALSLVIGAVHVMTGRGWACFRGLGAGLFSLGPALRARAQLRAARRANALTIARALTWNPLALLTRAPQVRPLRPR